MASPTETSNAGSGASMAVRRPEDFDPFSAEVVERPFDFYRALRDYAPVYPIPGAGYSVISRYEDVRAVAQDVDAYSSNLVAVLMQSEAGEKSAVSMPSLEAGPVDVLAIQDPPRHTGQRRLVRPAFGRHFVTGMEPRIRALANQTLDDLLSSESVDWVAGYANRLPMALTLEVTGFPASDREHVKALTDGAIALLSGVNTAEQFAEHAGHAAALYQYICQVYSDKERTGADDFTGSLVREVARGDDHLTEREACSMLLQLLIAGNDSTGSLIGSAMLLMVRVPELQRFLRAHPERIADFVEEVLRLESPFLGHFRVARRDGEVAGVPISEGTRLMLLWAAANRDEREFDDPDAIDLDRRTLQKHLAFGHGLHHCLGAPLARMVARITLEQVLARTESIEPGGGEVRHIPSLFTRTLAVLPIRPVPTRTD